MQLICISRGSYSKGKEVAESLAKKLGYLCVAREQIADEAIKAGIAIGKLETSMLKPHIFNEKLVLEKEHYQAFSTNYLLEQLIKHQNIIYHGFTGHLLFPGIQNILRIRVVADEEYRINIVMQHLNMNRDQAKKYIHQIGEDRKRWVRMFYNVDWDIASNYDLIINLEFMSEGNASAALCTLAQLPDFQMTPASHKAVNNMLLASRVRLALAKDERTYKAQLTVQANNGIVSVSYRPQQAYLAEHIPEILANLPDVREIVCTVAQTTILWIQEHYQADTDTFHELSSLAQKWDAAVEVLRFKAVEEDIHEVETISVSTSTEKTEYNGGIEDDEEEVVIDDGGLKQIITELIKLGRFGGGHSVRTTARRVTECIPHNIQYSLVVVGDVFTEKGHAAQTRMGRELNNLLHEKLHVPVVMADELKQQYLFGINQLCQLAIYFVLSAFIYILVFSNEIAVLSFLQGNRYLVASAVFAFVPTIAYLYGNTARLFLKLLRIE